jgi:hypothetical protein
MQKNIVDWYLLNGFIYDSLARTCSAFISGETSGNWSQMFAWACSNGNPIKLILLRIAFGVFNFSINWLAVPSLFSTSV